MPAFWVSNTRREWFHSLMPDFMDSQYRKNPEGFFNSTTAEYFGRYENLQDELDELEKERLQKEEEDLLSGKKKKRSKPLNKKDIVEDDDDENDEDEEKEKGKGGKKGAQDEHEAWRIKRTRSIRNWFYNNHPNAKKDVQCRVTFANAPARALTEYQLYSKKYYDERVKPLVDLELAKEDFDPKMKLTVTNQITKEQFDNESQGIKEEIAKLRDDILSERTEALSKLQQLFKGKHNDMTTDRSPQDMARFLNVLGQVLKAVFDMLGPNTGWCWTIIGGGPDPRKPDAAFSTATYHTGTTPAGLNFAEASPLLHELLMVPFGKFLNQVYPLEVQLQRAVIKGDLSIEAEIDKRSENPLARSETDVANTDLSRQEEEGEIVSMEEQDRLKKKQKRKPKKSNAQKAKGGSKAEVSASGEQPSGGPAKAKKGTSPVDVPAPAAKDNPRDAPTNDQQLANKQPNAGAIIAPTDTATPNEKVGCERPGGEIQSKTSPEGEIHIGRSDMQAGLMSAGAGIGSGDGMGMNGMGVNGMAGGGMGGNGMGGGDFMGGNIGREGSSYMGGLGGARFLSRGEDLNGDDLMGGGNFFDPVSNDMGGGDFMGGGNGIDEGHFMHGGNAMSRGEYGGRRAGGGVMPGGDGVANTGGMMDGDMADGGNFGVGINLLDEGILGRGSMDFMGGGSLMSRGGGYMGGGDALSGNGYMATGTMTGGGDYMGGRYSNGRNDVLYPPSVESSMGGGQEGFGGHAGDRGYRWNTGLGLLPQPNDPNRMGMGANMGSHPYYNDDLEQGGWRRERMSYVRGSNNGHDGSGMEGIKYLPEDQSAFTHGSSQHQLEHGHGSETPRPPSPLLQNPGDDSNSNPTPPPPDHSSFAPPSKPGKTPEENPRKRPAETVNTEISGKRVRKATQDAPEWVKQYKTYLLENIEDEQWARCIDLWFKFEVECQKPGTGNTRFSSLSKRPVTIVKWFKSKSLVDPKVPDVGQYASEWIEWWKEVQPKERREGPWATGESGNTTPSFEWMKKPGNSPGGLIAMVVGLRWWAKAENTEVGWGEAVATLSACLAQVVGR